MGFRNLQLLFTQLCRFLVGFLELLRIVFDELILILYELFSVVTMGTFFFHLSLNRLGIDVLHKLIFLYVDDLYHWIFVLNRLTSADSAVIIKIHDTFCVRDFVCVFDPIFVDQKPINCISLASLLNSPLVGTFSSTLFAERLIEEWDRICFFDWLAFVGDLLHHLLLRLKILIKQSDLQELSAVYSFVWVVLS